MAGREMSIKVIISAIDQASAKLKTIAGSMSGLGRTAGTLEKRLGAGREASDRFNNKWSETLKITGQVGRGMTVAGGAIVGGLAMATNAAADFNKGLGEVSTLVDTTTVSMSKMKTGVNGLAMETGQSAGALTKAMYQAISAGVDASESVGFLGVAAKAAVGGVTETETAVNGITNVINAFGMKTEDAARISDGMFTAVKAGKTTFGELSDSMFQVAPAAAAAGVSMEETFAAISSLTAAGVPTRVATTQIRAAMVGLMRPSEELNAIFAKQGFATGEAAIKAKGLKFALDVVKDATGGSSSQLQQLLGSVEAVSAANVLAGTGSEKFAADIQAQANASGAAAEAYKKMAQEGSTAFARLKETGGVLLRTIGDAVLPIAADLAKALIPVARIVARIAGTPIGKWAIVAGAAIGVLMMALGPLLMALPGILSAVQFLQGAGGLTPLIGTIGKLTGGLLKGGSAIAGFGAKIAALAVAGGPIIIAAIAIAGLAYELYKLKQSWDATSEAARQANESYKAAQATADAYAEKTGTQKELAAQRAEQDRARITLADRFWGALQGGGRTSKDIARERVFMSQAAPGRAGGGPVAARQAYVVGEEGPELFVPGQSGRIVPHGDGGRSDVQQVVIRVELAPGLVARDLQQDPARGVVVQIARATAAKSTAGSKW